MSERSGQRRGTTRRGATLTAREMQVLRLSGQGVSTKRIAERLSIGVDRVKTIKRQIKDNLGLGLDATTDDMVAQARSFGFFSN